MSRIEAQPRRLSYNPLYTIILGAWFEFDWHLEECLIEALFPYEILNIEIKVTASLRCFFFYRFDDNKNLKLIQLRKL